MADWRYDVIKAIGGKPSSRTLAFLQGWGTKEGGHIHNTARFNWLNRVDTSYPSAGTSQRGIAAYPDYQTGVARTAQLIQSGYPSIYQALQQGQVSFQDPGVQGDLNRWLTGKRTPGASPYVQSVAKLAGTPVAPGAGATPAPVAAQPQAQPQPRFQPNLQNMVGLLGSLQQRREAREQGERPSIGPLIGQLMAMRQRVPPDHQMQDIAAPTPLRTEQSAEPRSQGGFLQAPLAGSWQGTHVTDGLGWGTKTARDIMEPAGTVVGAPEDGEIVYFHPTGAQGGGSMLIRTASGREYWLGHIANGLPGGTRITRGQQIATISKDHANPHLHIDYR